MGSVDGCGHLDWGHLDLLIVLVLQVTLSSCLCTETSSGLCDGVFGDPDGCSDTDKIKRLRAVL